MSRRDRSSRGSRMMSWCWIMRWLLGGRGVGGHRTSSCGLMEATWCIHVLPPAAGGPRARSRLVPGIPGENTASLLQVLTIRLSWLNQFLLQFLFLSLALFLHLPCQRQGDRGIQSGEPAWPVVQTTGKALQFFLTSFYSIRVTHLCTSPLECEIAGVCHTEPGRFSMQMGGISLQPTVMLCCSLSPRIGRTTESNWVGSGVCNTHETSFIPFLTEIWAPKWANNHLFYSLCGFLVFVNHSALSNSELKCTY